MCTAVITPARMLVIFSYSLVGSQWRLNLRDFSQAVIIFWLPEECLKSFLRMQRRLNIARSGVKSTKTIYWCGTDTTNIQMNPAGVWTHKLLVTNNTRHRASIRPVITRFDCGSLRTIRRIYLFITLIQQIINNLTCSSYIRNHQQVEWRLNRETIINKYDAKPTYGSRSMN